MRLNVVAEDIHYPLHPGCDSPVTLVANKEIKCVVVLQDVPPLTRQRQFYNHCDPLSRYPGNPLTVHTPTKKGPEEHWAGAAVGPAAPQLWGYCAESDNERVVRAVSGELILGCGGSPSWDLIRSESSFADSNDFADYAIVTT